MLKCPNLPEILFPHVNDSDTWCKLSEVNRKFYETAKKMLVVVREINQKYGYMKTYTKILGTGLRHGLYQRIWCNGQKVIESYYKNGELHGPYYRWYLGGKKWNECNYLKGKLHGRYCLWGYDGLWYCEEYYHNGEINNAIINWLKMMINKITPYPFFFFFNFKITGNISSLLDRHEELPRHYQRNHIIPQ
jgi:antitoxin component YwqK of YwqJK toxin-antitoxin module